MEHIHEICDKEIEAEIGIGGKRQMAREEDTVIIKRTCSELERPEGVPGGHRKVTTVTEEIYDFSKAEDRKAVMGKIAHDMLIASNFNRRALDGLFDELKEVIRGMDGELPFR